VSYSAARINQGFKELLDLLRAPERPDIAAIIKANTLARQTAQERVRREYAAYGIEPPCYLALSMTARRELGIGIVYVQPEEEAA
jgi:single-stranded DNA-specific DHH superfamily exonuclease